MVRALELSLTTSDARPGSETLQFAADEKIQTAVAAITGLFELASGYPHPGRENYKLIVRDKEVAVQIFMERIALGLQRGTISTKNLTAAILALVEIVGGELTDPETFDDAGIFFLASVRSELQKLQQASLEAA